MVHGEGLGEWDTGRSVAEGHSEGVREGLRLADRESESVTVGHREGVVVGLRLADRVRESVAVGHREGEVEMLRVLVPVTDAVNDWAATPGTNAKPRTKLVAKMGPAKVRGGRAADQPSTAPVHGSQTPYAARQFKIKRHIDRSVGAVGAITPNLIEQRGESPPLNCRKEPPPSKNLRLQVHQLCVA